MLLFHNFLIGKGRVEIQFFDFGRGLEFLVSLFIDGAVLGHEVRKSRNRAWMRVCDVRVNKMYHIQGYVKILIPEHRNKN